MPALKLLLRLGKLSVQAVYHIELILRKLDAALLGYIVQEQKQVDERDLVLPHILLHLLVIGVAGGVEHEQRRGRRIVQLRELGKLRYAEPVA